jgi:hypothetical protein
MPKAAKAMKRTFGRDYIVDPRDRRYLLRTKASKRWSKTWRLGKVTDQGSAASCVGHAWYQWFGASPIRQRPITADGIYELAKHFDEWDGTNYDGTSLRGAAKVLMITGHIREYRWSFDIDSTIEHVLGNGPVVVGTNWYSGMSDPGNGMMQVKGGVLGGHSYLVYGADTRKELFKIRNSWGTSWGVKGNSRISFTDFDRLIGEAGEVCAAIESRVK